MIQMNDKTCLMEYEMIQMNDEIVLMEDETGLIDDETGLMEDETGLMEDETGLFRWISRLGVSTGAPLPCETFSVPQAVRKKLSGRPQSLYSNSWSLVDSV